VEVSESGYLYMLTQGTSGTWEIQFPSPKIRGGDNRVDSDQPQTLSFKFAGKPGVEKLFIIFSRQSEPDMDNWIYLLLGAQAAPTSGEPSKPKSPPSAFLMAKVPPIDNSVVERLHDVYSRDLIIDPLPADEPAKPAKKQDMSVYVVNPKGSLDTHVVADIRLVHEE
jgi:hypothetical protein